MVVQHLYLSQIEKFGNNFWIDLEKNPHKYANIYIVPNILVGRWFQLGLIINGQVLEIYINSKLSQSIILQTSLITRSISKYNSFRTYCG